MEKLQHIVTDLHRVYLTEMEAKIQPKIANKKEQPTNAGGDGGDAIKKAARQLAYDTRYKARREDLPLERAFNQVLQNSSASSPVKDAAKAMLFGGGDTKKEEYEIDEASKQKVLVKPAKGFGKSYRRYADTKKIHQLRKNPQIASVTPTNYGTPYEGERKKGEQTAAALQAPKGNPKKKDYDGDGKVESGSKEHAGAVHNAIQRKKGGVPDGKDTRKKKNEDYSDWRSELNLFEAETETKEKKVTGNGVNNGKYITINPELKEAVDNLGGVLIEDVNLTEDYIIESVNYATDYFYNEGLNEEGVEYVIEEIGIDRFFDFVMELNSYYNSQLNEDIELDEARAAKKRKGGKSYEQVKAEIDAKEKAKAAKKASAAKPAAKPAAKAPSVPTASAKQKQPNKKPVRDAIARGVFRAVDAYKKGMDRHNAAMKTAKKAATVGGKAASEFGKGFASGVKTAGKVAKDVKKVVSNEESDPSVTAKQKDTERKQVENARQRIRSMVGESNNINELNRAEKETGINTKTGKPTAKGGMKDDKAFTQVKRSIRRMEGTPAGQRKKVPGKKPPTAGQWGAPRSPAQKIAARRAAAKRSQEMMSSRFD